MGYDKEAAQYNNDGKVSGWIKKDKNGQDYLSCTMQLGGKKIYFKLFKNKYKTTDNMPSYVGTVSENIR